ncbi:MAG TPA: phenylalanine--tRNA ligase subunit beta [Kofleriaceae bacterium]|jgi:phenylalanyl-tRNA synthetase beta chain|nr:phenylalanine--tRNA ligase subunit beta [Kofleriaceae bacterium]
MKVLWSWLLEMCDLDKQPTVEEGARALTRGGLEIEGTTNLGAGFTGVVVAEVVAKQPHPQSDKLTLVDVITERGGTATRVVCGANNVPAPGRKVLWAQVGATLPQAGGGTITLGAKPVKGIVSPGMLCAEDELGLGEDHAGIIVLDEDDRTALGAPAQRALGIDDWMLEVNAPANRGDVLGHLGVARELVAMLGGKLMLPDTDLSGLSGRSDPGAGTRPAIEIADAIACPRYTARVIDGLTVAPSPRRIAQRLRGVGVRPISNLVDITNYVMFELGQPLHAFDADTLTSGTIGISHAADGEKFTTLDGVQRTLVPGDLVIRDGLRGIALAGVMGGLDSEVTERTTRVLLETASFQPLSVRRTARRLGLHSEASHRFERGVDPELAPLASARAARLLCMVGGGKLAGELFDAYPAVRPPAKVSVRLARVQMLTGVALDAATCHDALERLGFGVVGGGPESAGRFEVTPPSARGDIAREVDVIEEILRVVGYEQVSPTLPILRQAPGLRARDRGDIARAALAAAGASEAVTYGFQSAARCLALGIAATDRRAQPIALRNPMSSDQSVMRTSLLPNLLAAVARNQSHGRPDVSLFEVGSVFLRRGEGMTERPMHELADEPTWAAGVLAGRRPSQIGLGTPWDVFDAKALAWVAIRAVAGDTPLHVRQVRSVPYLHPGVAGEIIRDQEVVGWFGEVHPEVRKNLGVDGSVFAFDLDLTRLPLAAPAQMQPIPRFPASTRDVSLLLAAEIPAARVTEVIEQVSEPLVQRIRLLEDYRDAKLGDGRKSMLWSIEYRSPERTLTDVEVDKAHETIVGRLVENLPAQRR